MSFIKTSHSASTESNDQFRGELVIKQELSAQDLDFICGGEARWGCKPGSGAASGLTCCWVGSIYYRCT